MNALGEYFFAGALHILLIEHLLLYVILLLSLHLHVSQLLLHDPVFANHFVTRLFVCHDLLRIVVHFNDVLLHHEVVVLYRSVVLLLFSLLLQFHLVVQVLCLILLPFLRNRNTHFLLLCIFFELFLSYKMIQIHVVRSMLLSRSQK